MKNLIVLTFTFMFIVLGLVQFANFQISETKRDNFDRIVENSSQRARMEGYFTPVIKEKMLTDIEATTKIPRDEIKVLELTETRACRSETFTEASQVKFKIAIPIKNNIAGANLFGITDDENMYWYPAQGSVTSEKNCKG